MRVVILAGGFGTRLGEETGTKPKPMVEIGSKPILWHIMKTYAHYGMREFVVALGYKGEVIKRYFHEYHALSSDLSIDLRTGKIETGANAAEDWLIHLRDTGQDVMTGGRVKRLEPMLEKETFMLTYGDGVSNVDIAALLAFHKRHGKLATVTAVRPPSRFGGIVLNGDSVAEFIEKPQIGEGWINGGYMVFEPGVFKYFGSKGDACILESDVLEALAQDGQLMAYRHEKFWQCMDTVRELNVLQSMWASGSPPWRVWT